MSNEYIPKSNGVTLLRFQVASVERRCNKMAKKGIIYKNPLITLPLNQGKDLIKRLNNNRIRFDVLNKLSTRLSNHLDADKKNYNYNALKEITDTIFVVLSEIEQ